VKEVPLLLAGSGDLADSLEARLRADDEFWAGREGFRFVLQSTRDGASPASPGAEAGVVVDCGGATTAMLLRAVHLGYGVIATDPRPLAGPLADYHVLVADRRTRRSTALAPGLPLGHLLDVLGSTRQPVREITAALSSPLNAICSSRTARTPPPPPAPAAVDVAAELAQLTARATLLARDAGVDAPVRNEVPDTDAEDLATRAGEAFRRGMDVRVAADVSASGCVVRLVELPRPSIFTGAGAALVAAITASAFGPSPVVLRATETLAATVTAIMGELLDLGRESDMPWRTHRRANPVREAVR
jgi:hypothetical protein